MTERGLEVKKRLAELLEAVPAMTRNDGRNAVLEEFKGHGYDLPVMPAGETVRMICYRVIRFAAGEPGALQQLADTVRWFDQSTPADNFADEVRNQLPGDFFSLDDRLRFIEEMRKLVQPDQLHMYYRLAVGEIYPSGLADVSDLARELEELTFNEQCHPLVIFTEAVADKTKKIIGINQARKWSDRLARLIDASMPGAAKDEQAKLAALRESQKRKRAGTPDRERASFVVMLDPYVPKPADGYLLSIWLYRAEPVPSREYVRDAPASLGVIREEVIDKLQKVIKSLSKPGKVAEVDLEFFLPRELLDYAVEDWVVSEGNVTLGALYVVVVRDRDRLHKPLLWPPWQEKWQHLTDGKAAPDEPFSHWITCMDKPCRVGELYPSLLSDEMVSIGLTFPPPPGVRRFELAEALNAGTPIIVWPRGRCEHPVPASNGDPCQGISFRESLCQEMTGRDLTDLPQRVRALRRARAAGLALLWDNPHRIPIPVDSDPDALDAPKYWPQS